MERSSKRIIFFGIIFGLLSIFFFLMYYFDVIKLLDKFLSVIYMVYFLGLAIVYAGMYCNLKNHKMAKNILYLISGILIALSITMLVYGFSTGRVSLLN